MAGGQVFSTTPGPAIAVDSICPVKNDECFSSMIRAISIIYSLHIYKRTCFLGEKPLFCRT